MTKTALITGTTSGIGYELSKLCASKGINLVLISRNKEKLEVQKKNLEEQYSISVHIIPCDLSEPHVAENIIKYIEKENIDIDYLINNA
jgi:short-subunit dehydrogenase